MKNILVLAAIAGVGFWGVSAAQVGKFDRRIQQTFDVQPGGTLDLKSDRGTVAIKSHNGNQVEVDIKLSPQTNRESKAREWLDRFDVSFDQVGKDVKILGEWESKLFSRNAKLNVSFDIKVPKEYDIKVKTSGGGIKVSDIDGEIDVNTSGGSISVGEVAGSVKANTSGGSISLNSANGPAVLTTSGGKITAGQVNGSVEAKTSGGRIELKGVNGNLFAKTSGGSIQAELYGQIDAPAELRTSGGSIKLGVSPDFKATIDAKTSGGRVSCELPITVSGKLKRNEVRGQVNGGGPKVTLHTSGGSISISEL